MRIFFLCALVAGALALFAGCSRTTKSGEATGTGLFTGYELGNSQEQAQIRDERPGGLQPRD